MWDTIFNTIKSISDKHLYPVIGSVAIALCSKLVIASFHGDVIDILGEQNFEILVFCTSFIIIESMQKHNEKKKIKHREEMAWQYEEQEKRKEEQEFIEKMRCKVDNCSPEEREALKQFIKTNNAPMEKPILPYSSMMALTIFESDWMYSTYEDVDKKVGGYKFDKQNSQNENGYEKIEKMRVKKYKLKPQVYDALKIVLKNDRGISHFD